MTAQRLFKFSFFIFALSFLFVFSTKAVSAASLSLSPATGTYGVGNTFSADIVVDTEGQPISGATAIVNYDTAKLQVVDDDSSTTGVQIKAGAILTQVLTNTVDATTGEIRFDAGSLGSNYTGRDVLATITFKTLTEGTAQVSFAFDLNATTGTSLVAAATGGTSLLSTVNDASYTISSTGGGNSGGGNSTTTTTTTTLPNTGVVEDTILLITVGLVLMGTGVFLAKKFLFF